MEFFDSVTQWDLDLLAKIQELRTPFWDKFFSVFTRFGDAITVILLALILILIPKTRRIGFSMAAAMALGLLFGNIILKPWVARIRPYDLPGALIDSEHLLITMTHDFSFPSGHTMAMFEGATVLAVTQRKKYGIRIPALLFACAILFSRLYLYVHFPTDCLVGMLMGIGFGFLGTFLWDKIGEKIFVACWNFVFRKHKIEHV